MEKEAKKDSQYLINLMLDRELKRDKTRFSDVDIKDFQNTARTKKMLADLELRDAEVERLKKEANIKEEE